MRFQSKLTFYIYKTMFSKELIRTFGSTHCQSNVHSIGLESGIFYLFTAGIFSWNLI